ncbi:MAG TPA: TIR domain-containing protein [Candidatus Angelobacter sp.]
MPATSPYQGLTPYSEDTAGRFFGREEEVTRSVQRLIDHGFLAVVGPSGIGKSSFISAGIIPALRASHYSLFDPIIFCRFGVDPVANLATALACIADRKDCQQVKPLLVIDQFEELYTVVDSVDRENVLHEIVPLIHDKRIAVLIALRADFFGRLIDTPVLARESELSTILLGPLSQANLRRAIIEPATDEGISFEDGVVDRIVADAGSDAANLPLLQILLFNLVKNCKDHVITLSDYHRQGDFHGTFDQTLEGIWRSFNESDQERIRSLMLRLATPEGTRRAVSLDEFSENDHQLVNQLVAQRVLTVYQDATSRQATVEVVHESIFRDWRRYAVWVEEEREFLKLRGRISDAATSWTKANHDSSYLLVGSLLSQARELLDSRHSYLTVLEHSFVEQSIKASDRFSAWKMLSRGLGLAKLEKEIIERDERRTKIRDELTRLEEQLRQMENRKTQLDDQLEQNRQELDSMAPKIFLSYASEDFPQVKPVYDELKQQGLCPWLDRENLLPGVDWDREIVREIKQSHFVLFFLSNRSLNKRGYVQKELRTALRAFEEIPSGQTYLIPVRLEECTVPVELSKYQFADLFRDGEFDKLLKSILTTWAESSARG